MQIIIDKCETVRSAPTHIQTEYPKYNFYFWAIINNKLISSSRIKKNTQRNIQKILFLKLKSKSAIRSSGILQNVC